MRVVNAVGIMFHFRVLAHLHGLRLFRLECRYLHLCFQRTGPVLYILGCLCGLFLPRFSLLVQYYQGASLRGVPVKNRFCLPRNFVQLRMVGKRVKYGYLMRASWGGGRASPRCQVFGVVFRVPFCSYFRGSSHLSFFCGRRDLRVAAGGRRPFVSTIILLVRGFWALPRLPRHRLLRFLSTISRRTIHDECN